ncbi:MAG: LuxR C-terminal-related transcriptional regulator [bacterium]
MRRQDYTINILEHLEQGIALVDQSFKIVSSNRRFKILIQKHFDANNLFDMLGENIRDIGDKKRIIVKLEGKTGLQFYLIVKHVVIRRNRFYLLTLHKKRVRKIDLFKLFQSEYKISKEQFNIITYLAKGFTNNEIARLCNLKPCNVKYHLSHLYNTFYVSNRTELLNKVRELENEVF